MGMYSYFKEDEIEVVDAVAFAEWFDKLLDEYEKKGAKLYGDYPLNLQISSTGGKQYRLFFKTTGDEPKFIFSKKNEGEKLSRKSFVKKLSEIDNKRLSLSFQGFDDMKIISYWYEEFCAFLRDVAIFIDGSVYWDFENSDEAGWVDFDNGEVIIHAGQMSWSETPVDEMRNLKKMSADLKGLKMLIRGL